MQGLVPSGHVLNACLWLGLSCRQGKKHLTVRSLWVFSGHPHVSATSPCSRSLLCLGECYLNMHLYLTNEVYNTCPSKAHAVTAHTQSSQTFKTATQRLVNALLGTQLMLLFANVVESSCLAAGMCKLLNQPALQRQNFALAPLLSAWGEMVCVQVRECRGLPAIKHIRIQLSLEREVKELLLPFESSSQIVQHQTKNK